MENDGGWECELKSKYFDTSIFTKFYEGPWGRVEMMMGMIMEQI